MQKTFNFQKGFITLPGAIIIAAAIIAIAIIWVNKPAGNPATAAQKKQPAEQIHIAPVTTAEHILGNPNADVKIVEYSDPSCPYCKTFNPVMAKIMDEYGPTGKVAWIYRHYPLDKPDSEGRILHPNAGHEAQALECAASLGGNTKFWAFEKQLYTITPSVTPQSPEGLDQKKLPGIAKSAGIDPVAFNECLTSGQFKSKVETQFLDGVNANVTGTPTSFFLLSDTVPAAAVTYITNALLQYRVPANLLYISEDKKIIVMSGAMPEDLIKGLLTTLVGK